MTNPDLQPMAGAQEAAPILHSNAIDEAVYLAGKHGVPLLGIADGEAAALYAVEKVANLIADVRQQGATEASAAPVNEVPDELIDAVFKTYARANDHGTPYLRTYAEGFRNIARDLLRLATPQPSATEALRRLLAVYQAMGNPRGPAEIMAEAVLATPTTAPMQAHEPTPAALTEREEAPPNSLPSWAECGLRVDNSEHFAKQVAEGGYGPGADVKLATELHRFIYEYDDADAFRSAWFMHRLELLINEIRAASPPPAATLTDAQLVEHLHARGWRVELTDVPMLREAAAVLGGAPAGDVSDAEIRKKLFEVGLVQHTQQIIRVFRALALRNGGRL